MIDEAPSQEPTTEAILRRRQSYVSLRNQMGDDYEWIRSMAESYETMRCLMNYWKWMACPPKTQKERNINEY
jgi:hypothetical protein